MRLESLKFEAFLRGSKPEYNSSTQLQNSRIEKLYIYHTLHYIIVGARKEAREGLTALEGKNAVTEMEQAVIERKWRHILWMMQLGYQCHLNFGDFLRQRWSNSNTTPIFSNREILYSSYTTLTCKYKYQLRSQYSVYNGVSGVGGPHGHGRNVTVGERKRDIGI